VSQAHAAGSEQSCTRSWPRAPSSPGSLGQDNHQPAQNQPFALFSLQLSGIPLLAGPSTPLKVTKPPGVPPSPSHQVPALPSPAIGHLSSLRLASHGHLQTRGLLPDAIHPPSGPARPSPAGCPQTPADHGSLTLVGVGRSKNGAVLPLHFLHILGNFVDEPSNLFHLQRPSRQVSCERPGLLERGGIIEPYPKAPRTRLKHSERPPG